MLGNRVGGVGGHTEDVDAAKGVLHIHVIEAGTAKCDEADAKGKQRVDDGGVYGIVDKDTDTVSPAGEGHGILIQLGFKVRKGDAGCRTVAVKGGTVVRFGIKKR